MLFIVAGERRCEAAKKVGLAEVPAILVEGKHGEIALVENLLRQDLTAVEEAEALDRLMKEESYTQEQLGVIIGKARTTVGDILTLNKLPQEIRDECRGNTAVTRKTLITIARKKQARGMVTAWNKVKEKQAKEEAGSQRTPRIAPTPAAHREWLDKTNAKLTTIDSAAWTAEWYKIFYAGSSNESTYKFCTQQIAEYGESARKRNLIWTGGTDFKSVPLIGGTQGS